MKSFLRLLFLCFSLGILLPLSAQSPYRLEGVKEGFMLGIPINIHLYSRINFLNMDPLTKEKAELLRPTDVWAVDRWAVKNYPTGAKARKGSDWLLYSSFAWPMVMLASDRGRDDIGAMGTFYLQTLLINSALTNLAKSLAKRPRPLAYNEFVATNLKLEKGVRTSFFSGHTSTTAAMTFLTAKMYADFHPDSDLKPVVWASAALIPAATGFLRMRGGKHFLTDVLTGLVVGSAVGCLVPDV
ncbi:MAG: phosphatase PAP2 family protein, partial [Bacteroidota bacterium]